MAFSRQVRSSYTPPPPPPMATKPVRHVCFAPTITLQQPRGVRRAPLPTPSEAPLHTKPPRKKPMVYTPAVVTTEPITIPGQEENLAGGQSEWFGAKASDIQLELRTEHVRVHSSKDNVTDYCRRETDPHTWKLAPNGYCWEIARQDRLATLEQTTGRVVDGRLGHVGSSTGRRRGGRGQVQKKEVKLVPEHIGAEHNVRMKNMKLWERCMKIPPGNRNEAYQRWVSTGLKKPLEVEEVEDDGDEKWDEDDDNDDEEEEEEETDDEAVLYEDEEGDFERIRVQKKVLSRSSEDSGYETEGSKKLESQS
ncbi:hypothetical protein P154DRAFT_520634 [Amniculicola lignicola CBS 123094]|uniref:Uncharacterized protein n=1 Tax=Amniculicola lignicola CBS 123094 TaxID=1392246 RepID=A0A6A5WPB4_9PLEO|nr:hypothetical protein P154DRAFT_520634 [Amniculicola lignicola CBS 123094]